MNNLENQKLVRILLTYGNRAIYDGEIDSILAVYANMLNREKVFKIIEESARENINQDEMSEELQSLWNLHQALKTHGKGFFHKLRLINGLFSKGIILDGIQDSETLKQMLDKNLGERRKDDSYIVNGEFTEVLNKLSEEIDDYFVKKDEEEVARRSEKKDFVEKYVIDAENLYNKYIEEPDTEPNTEYIEEEQDK